MPTPVDSNRATFVRSEYRFETASQASVKALHPQANSLELKTNLSQASATGLASTILNATKTHALVWEIEIDGILNLEDFDGTVPHYTLAAALFNTDGRTYKFVGGDIDYASNITTIRMRSVEALAADTTAPTITHSATPTVAENQPFNMTLTANEAVNWAIIGGADAAQFSLTGSTLSMGAKNYEAPTDVGSNNGYEVIVRATDTSGNQSQMTMTVTVTDVNESTPDTTAPTITSSATQTVAENTPFSMTLTANETVTWSKIGGSEAALFTLSGNTLSMTAKDYEAPSDTAPTNSYVVQVRATDTAGNTTDQTITVTVTDVNEAAPVTLNALTGTFSMSENNAAGVVIGTPGGFTAGSTRTLANAAGGRVSINSTTGELSVGSTGTDYEIDGSSLTIVVRETLAGATNSPRDTTFTITVTNVVVNPTWTSSTTTSVAENAVLAYTLAATGASSYSIVGGADQARFEIGGTTLRWLGNGTKDYEAPNDSDSNNTYLVTVRATGPEGTADQTITVTVTNVAEAAPANTITWNSADIQTVVLEHGNLSVSKGRTPGGIGDNYFWGGARANFTISSGKYYYEMLSRRPENGNFGIGYATAAADLGDPIDDGGTKGVVSYITGFPHYGWGTDPNTFKIGDIMGAAIDVAAQKVWWSKNGVWANGDPVAGTGGHPLTVAGPFYPVASTQYPGDWLTARFSPASQAFRPTGYTAIGDDPAAVALDPGNAYVLNVLTNNNLTITGESSSGTPQFARATAKKTTGKHYFEVKTDSKTKGHLNVAVASSAYTFQQYKTGPRPGSSDFANGATLRDDGYIWNSNGTIVQQLFTEFVTGDVWNVAFDCAAQKVWFGKNGTWNGNPAAGTGGFATGSSEFYAMVGPQNDDTMTARFKASSFTNTIPSGFSAYDPN